MNDASFGRVAGSQQCNLDVIGNWLNFNTDLNGGGSYASGDDHMVAGQFNDVNEVDGNGVNPDLSVTHQGSSVDLDFTYDKAGNLQEQELSSSTSLKYTHDAWGRLVKAEYLVGSTPYARGEYQYNGLSQRVVKRSDHNILDNSAQLDEQRLLYYSGSWQIVEERIYDAWTAESPGSVDRIVQHVWGLRYIDDIILDREDAGANGSYENTWYHLTDLQFSTVALIDSSAHLIERVEYTPYGEARHHWKFDVDGDGDVDAADGTAVSTASGSSIYQSGYNPDADFDRDGDVDRYDTLGSYAGALPAGQISDLSVGNSIGYCGYVFNGEAGSGGLYTVRFRHLDPAAGRWLQRDPAGYSDGMNLYGYISDRPILFTDPSGLMTGIVNARDPELHSLPQFQPFLKTLHQSAEETEALLQGILDLELAIVKEVAWIIVTGGAGEIIGRLAVKVLARYGPAALAAIRALGRGAFEGMEKVILGGIIVVWKGGEWIIKGVASFLYATSAGAAKNQLVSKIIWYTIGYGESQLPGTGGPPKPSLPIPIGPPSYYWGWIAGQLENECERHK